MSKVTITFEMGEVVCNNLRAIRDMDKNRDYSGLMAQVERIQLHVNNMEEGLWETRTQKNAGLRVLREAKGKKVTDSLIKEVEKKLDE